MLITGRAATRRLERAGLTSRQARQLLEAGLAGTPERCSASLLYDDAAVDALARRPRVGVAELDAACPHGVFVARAGRRRIDVGQPGEAQLAAFRDGWALSLGVVVWLGFQLDRGGLPFVVSVAGFVVAGADIVGVRAFGAGSLRRCTLELADPGRWFGSVEGHRLRTGPGRDWSIRGLPWSAASDVDRVGE